MNLAINRTRFLPQFGFLRFGKNANHQSSRKRLENIGHEICHKEKQREIDQYRKCKLIVLENPANRSTCKCELAPVIGKIASIVLVLLPKLLSRHRVLGIGGCLVPGFPVGGWLGGGGLGGGVAGLSGIDLIVVILQNAKAF